MTPANLPIHWAMDSRHLRAFLPQISGLNHARRAGLEPLPMPGAASIPRAADKPYDITDGVACLDLCGPMMPDVPDFFEAFGVEACSTAALTAAVIAAAADPAVVSIRISIDSPGGAVPGVEQLAAAVAGCGKPTTALVTGLCCSAAYWVASQCDQILAADHTCEIGSIGTYCVAYDQSAQYAANGIAVHLISSGGVKGQGSDGVPISADYLAKEQTIVDQLTALFIAGVNTGRNADLTALATGHTWLTDQAQLLGLIDGLADSETLSQAGTKLPAITAAFTQHTAKDTGMDLQTLTKLTAEHSAHAVQIVALAAAGKSAAEISSTVLELATRAKLENLTNQLSAATARADQLAAELADSKAAHAAELAAAQSAAVTAGKLATLAAGAPSDPGPGDAPDAKAPEFSSADAAAGKIPLALLQSGNYRIK
jgi:ClpP class serine protease